MKKMYCYKCGSTFNSECKTPTLCPLCSKEDIVDGICCYYCIHFENDSCPVKVASPWSKWGNYCNMYRPNPEEPDAKKLVVSAK